jgi:hypothetical protein
MYCINRVKHFIDAVSLKTPYYSDTIGGHVRHRRPCLTSAALSDIGGQKYHRLLKAVALSANVVLFSMLNRSDCRKKEGD